MSHFIDISDLAAYGPVQITSTSDNATLNQAIEWAEGEFERLTGSLFYQGTETDELPARVWFDRNGALSLIARHRGPVTAVASVQIKILGVIDWTPITWNPADIQIPFNDAPPRPNAWRVTLYPNNINLSRIAADGLWAKWTYTGGYAATPEQLKLILLRMAFWKLKLREAPLGRINSEMFGTREIIPNLPKDIGMDIGLWRRKVMG